MYTCADMTEKFAAYYERTHSANMHTTTHTQAGLGKDHHLLHNKSYRVLCFSALINQMGVPNMPGGPSTGDTMGSWSGKYPDGEFSRPRLKDLRREVAGKIPDQWKDVGLELGLDYGKLSSIESEREYQNNKERFTRVFELWEKQSGHGDVHPYKWKYLLDALHQLEEFHFEEEIRKRLTEVPRTQLVPTSR